VNFQARSSYFPWRRDSARRHNYVLFAALQWRGIAWGSSSQNITSFIKALAFVALIAACFIFGKGTTGATAIMPVPVGFALNRRIRDFSSGGLSLPTMVDGRGLFLGRSRRTRKKYPALIVRWHSFNHCHLSAGKHRAALCVASAKIAGQDFAVGMAANEIFGKHGDTVFSLANNLVMLSAINAYHLMATRVCLP